MAVGGGITQPGFGFVEVTHSIEQHAEVGYVFAASRQLSDSQQQRTLIPLIVRSRTADVAPWLIYHGVISTDAGERALEFRLVVNRSGWDR
ncbi:hypothetical protein ACWFRF_05005 [Nocardia sp. NPDC055165]